MSLNYGHTHLPNTVGMQCGVDGPQTIAKSGGSGAFNVTFPTAFLSPPVVVVGLAYGTGSNCTHCMCAVQRQSVTTTGFTYTIQNHSGSSMTPSITWIAVGTPVI